MFELIKNYNVIKDEQGNKKRYTNFYLVHKTSGNSIQVKPAFETDFKTMLFLAKEEVKKEKK